MTRKPQHWLASSFDGVGGRTVKGYERAGREPWDVD